MPSTRDRILATALQVIGADGIRVLTHRRVDALAGLPAGSTANHFRTRAALLSGIADYLVELELSQLFDPLPTERQAFLDSTAHSIDILIGPLRQQTAARMALFLEAGRMPELGDHLALAHRRYRHEVEVALTAMGAPDPHTGSKLFLSIADGIIQHRIAHVDNDDPRPALEMALRAILGKVEATPASDQLAS